MPRYGLLPAGLSICLCLVAGMALAASAPYPQWWLSRGVINTNSPITNDFAAVNQGQLKWISLNAYEHMQTHLDGGPGPSVSNLIVSLSTTNNYLPVNQGQLKYVAAVFYDRLVEAGKINARPWTNSLTANDYGLVNVGQVKALFSFDLSITDTDGDGLPDQWELDFFGDMSESAAGDYDGDGLSNFDEYTSGTRPGDPDTDGDGTADGWECAHGLAPLDASDGAEDTDLDGFINRDEYIIGSDPATDWAYVALESFGVVFYQPNQI
jgi:hypothetical protein